MVNVIWNLLQIRSHASTEILQNWDTGCAHTGWPWASMLHLASLNTRVFFVFHHLMICILWKFCWGKGARISNTWEAPRVEEGRLWGPFPWHHIRRLGVELRGLEELGWASPSGFLLLGKCSRAVSSRPELQPPHCAKDDERHVLTLNPMPVHPVLEHKD